MPPKGIVVTMLFESLLNHAKNTPQEIAIQDDTGRFTYQQVAAFAAGLGKCLPTLTQRSNVGLLLPAGVGFVASFYGTLLAGKSVVPINFLQGEREIAHVIADSGIDTILTIPFLAGKIKAEGIKIIDLTQLPRPQSDAPIEQNWPAASAKSADDIAVIMYTSGTSGLPKGVMLSFGNLQSDVDSCIAYVGLERRHKFLGVIPLFHSFGMTAMMIAPIQLGAGIIYMARFSGHGAVAAIREHQVSLLFAVPSMFAAMAHVKNGSAEDFKSIYALISGGEPLPGTVREKFTERFGMPIYEGYGLTETSPVVALNTPDIHRPGSVGKPVPGVRVRIVDDAGTDVKPGDSGEVWLAGPMIMKGYHNLPAETAAVLTPDGFFKTGDLGRIDEDGFLYITGRKKELIIVAGEKVSPREVEDTLAKHPGVGEAAVVGKKDPQRGEVVVAFVLAKEGQQLRPDELRDFCRTQGLAQFKVPREVFVESELPRSPTGKVLKRILVERLAG
jgi:long-chain acyl-CoA synthetase